ncbi:MAG: NAD(P)H-dependent glycerol-3-phosphate dehydrogenase [Lachnospiraceae bacterium]|nr:NAD(P)H-dependent glycerol-3-phosphate dehydrogenase [Lachnospiraceae bacterium]
MAKIGVIGAGSWGIALAWLLINNGHEVQVWSAIESEIDMLKKEHEHKDKLPGVKLQDSMEFTTDLADACRDKDLLVLAVPSIFTRSTAKSMKDLVKEGQIITNVAKGVEEDTLLTLSQIIEEEIPQAVVTVLCGPSHAEEVAKGLPTTVVSGAHKKADAEYVQNIFSSKVFRVYTSPDMLGMELGAALKNVVALAAGMADGMGFGDNTKAALITRGIAEITRLGTAMGGKAETFAGLTGIGDLIVTCGSVHSRNRKAGYLMGQGKTAKEAMDEVKMVVEGVYSAKAALSLAKKYNVEMPIVEKVNEILFEDKQATDALAELMTRDKKSEHSSLPWEA